MIRILLIVFVFLLGDGATKTRFDREISQRRRELDQLKKELDQQREQLANLSEKEQGVIGKLDLVQRDISKTLQYIEALQKNRSLLELSIVEKQNEITALESDVERTRGLLKKKIRSLYKKGNPDYAQLLVQAESSTQFIEDWVLMKRLMTHDKKLIETLQKQVLLVESSERELQKRREEVLENEKQKSQESKRLSEKKEKENNWLREIQRDKEIRQTALEEYQAHQQILLSLIQELENKRKDELRRLELERKKKQEKPPKKQKMAKACRPVDGKIVSEFGLHMHPILKTKTRNLGVEIETNPSAEIRAAQPGTVAKVLQLPGRGLSVILDHGNSYYSVYGGLGKVFVREGQKVRSCEEIATIAPVGTPKKPLLYFQVSKGVETINPRNWID